MSNTIQFEEKQYLGHNRYSIIRRVVLALFFFAAFYFSKEGTEDADVFFGMGLFILLVSILLTFVLHYKTMVINDSIILDGLWTARRVKIDLSSVVEVKKVKYSRSAFNRSVYNLHFKGAVRFFTKGTYALKLTDKDGQVYFIGSQKPDEFKALVKSKIQS
jgi:hypothetical protein